VVEEIDVDEILNFDDQEAHLYCCNCAGGDLLAGTLVIALCGELYRVQGYDWDPKNDDVCERCVAAWPAHDREYHP
jgi:hypothetical protein